MDCKKADLDVASVLDDCALTNNGDALFGHDVRDACVCLLLPSPFLASPGEKIGRTSGVPTANRVLALPCCRGITPVCDVLANNKCFAGVD